MDWSSDQVVGPEVVAWAFRAWSFEGAERAGDAGTPDLGLSGGDATEVLRLVVESAFDASPASTPGDYAGRRRRQAWSRTSRYGQLSLIAIQILRTVTRTRAPIFRSFSRIVPH